MSVTFHPVDNHAYCQEHNLVQWDEYECQCVDFPEMFSEARPCRDCDGSGKVCFERLPFEANLANGNAAAVQRILRMPLDYSGICDPQVILDGIEFIRAMQGCGYLPLVSETVETGGEGTGECHMIHCGRTPDQVERYLVAFKEMAEEAKRRGVQIVWG